MIPQLDEATKEALNSLTIEETKRDISYPFEHEILWYGIDGVSHVHLMRQARKMSTGDFVAKYILEQDLNILPRKVPFCLSKTVEADDIFIPRCRYYYPWEEKYLFESVGTALFNLDYLNRMSDPWNLTSRAGKWKKEDFANERIVRGGIEFGTALWRQSVIGFERSLPDYPNQPKKVTDLARELIGYYSAIVLEPTT